MATRFAVRAGARAVAIVIFSMLNTIPKVDLGVALTIKGVISTRAIITVGQVFADMQNALHRVLRVKKYC